MSTPDLDAPQAPQPPVSAPQPPASSLPASPPPKSGPFSRRRSLKSPSEALQPEAAPPPPPPKKKKKREGMLSAFSGFLSFLLVLCVAGGFGLVAVQHRLKDSGPLTGDKVVYIAPGTEVPDIIATLEREGVIESPLMMNLQLMAEGARNKLKAGEYLFHQGASLREVIDELVNGRQILHGVTIPEGLTSQQIVDRLRGMDVLVGELREMPKEGSLLPETYKVPRGYALSRLLRDMQDAQKKVLDQVWARRNTDIPVRSPYELLTLASIVEKETGKADERPRVAGVFVNRLNKRMRLQSDPTIVYGLVGGRGTLGRGILRSEVEKWTPYNTYAIDGLPPGPIANPGRAALEAVANPSRTSELFFVADGTGGHVFASSLDEHNRNVGRWRQIERDARDKGQSTDVDRAQPASPQPNSPTTLPSRGEQRGDIGPNAIFGKLAALASDTPLIPPPSLEPIDASLVIARVAPVLPAHEDLLAIATFEPASAARLAAAPPPAEPWKTKAGDAAKGQGPLAANFNDPGIKVRGIDPNDALDGPMSDEPSASMDTYPVGAKTLADQKARAAKYGLAANQDDLPPPAMAYAPPQPGADGKKSRYFDASEGTALDPLRNKSWDLNSPKNVSSAMSYR